MNEEIRKNGASGTEEEDVLWQRLLSLQGQPFYTAKGLEFTYRIRGGELFISRKDKSITRATVMLAFRKAAELQRAGNPATGPKMLGVFGASYLYPLFQRLELL